MNRLLLGLWWFLMIPFVVNGQQVSLQATGEGLSSEEAQQAALAELSFRIAANVESQIDSTQELRNEEFNQTASQRLSVTSELPIAYMLVVYLHKQPRQRTGELFLFMTESWT